MNWDMGKGFQTPEMNRGTKNKKRKARAMYRKFRIPKNLHIAQNLNAMNTRFQKT
jgi:hypothetical protein